MFTCRGWLGIPGHGRQTRCCSGTGSRTSFAPQTGLSQFLIARVVYDRERDLDDVVFRTLLFKLFNRIDTWRGLEELVGEVSWHDYRPDVYSRAFDVLAQDGPIYSAAYMMPPPRLGERSKHRNHLRLLETMMASRLPDRIHEARSLREVYETLASFPSMGPFLAFQFTIDLNYTPVIAFDEDDFVVAGPGAVDGICKCFGPAARGSEGDVIRFVVESQETHFKRLGLSFSGLFGRRLHLIDAQNLFCEVDKYARAVHPDIPGRSGRSRIKQRFQPVVDRLTAIFPPRWNLEREARANEPRDQHERHRNPALAADATHQSRSRSLAPTQLWFDL